MGLHFWSDWSHVFGIRVDYFSPVLYLTDILILIFILSQVVTWKHWQQKRSTWGKPTILLLLGGLIILVINVTLSSIWQVSLFGAIKIIELTVFTFFITKFKDLNFKQDIVKPLSFSLLFFGSIAILQFLLQSTTGLFWIFGERSFDVATPGIALVELFGKNYMRIYGTFPHPNSLAGFFGVGLLLIMDGDFLKTVFGKVIFGVVSLVLILSLSQTVWLTLLGVSVVYLFTKVVKKHFQKKLILSVPLTKMILITSVVVSLIVFPVLSNKYVETILLPLFVKERMHLTLAAEEKIKDNFFVGTGLGTSPSYTRILQPTHNVFLLILSETGVVGLAVLLFFLFNLLSHWKKRKVESRFYYIALFFLLTGLTDHYWITLAQNQNIVALVLGLSLSIKKL